MAAAPETRAHWDRIYTTKLPTELSWYQEHPQHSIELIKGTGLGHTATVLDVGGGDSTLADHLVERGYQRVTVLDVSAPALSRARARLASNAYRVTWLETDILSATFPPESVDVWHDRAVFHFLVRDDERTAYLEQVRRALRPGGYVIVATFADDGPSRCSGLPVERYSADRLRSTFGDDFRVTTSLTQCHRTPGGAEQRFTYCSFRYVPEMVERPADIVG